MTDNMEQQIFNFFGQIITIGGGGAAVAYVIFKFLGKNWIETQFAKNLEQAKSEISLFAARKMKLHDMEYVVFPEIWSKLNKVFDSLGRTFPVLRPSPYFEGMDNNALSDWLDRSDFSDEEKRYFSTERNKSEAYSRILDLRDLRQAQNDYVDFHEYLQNSRIFLSPEIKDLFDKIGELINESWLARRMHWDGLSRDSEKNLMIEAYAKYKKEVKPLMLEIESLVQKKLFPEKPGKSKKTGS